MGRGLSSCAGETWPCCNAVAPWPEGVRLGAWFWVGVWAVLEMAFASPVGAPPPTATWGGLVREGFDNLLDAPGLSIYPSIAILIVMVGLNLVGDGLRDATDPRAPT